MIWLRLGEKASRMAKVTFEWDDRKAAENDMKNKIKSTDEPLELEMVEDFLPPPDQLVLQQDTVKVTIGLSRPTVEFFKARARRHHTQYQKMIRRLLDLYASRYG